MEFVVPVDNRVKLKKKNEKKDKYLNLDGKLKETVEHESDNYINCNCKSWFSHRIVIKGIGGLGNERMSRDHPICYITEIGWNTEKSPGNSRRHAVTKTPVKDHQITLV